MCAAIARTGYAQLLCTELDDSATGRAEWPWAELAEVPFPGLQSVCADRLLGAAVCLLGAGKPERHVSLFGRLQCVGGGTGARARHFMLMIIRLTSGAS